MPYIPENHKKYNLLPYCSEHGGEVFEYHSDSLDEVGEILRLSGDSLMPYGYKSYEEYFQKVDCWIEKYKADSKKRKLLEKFKREMIQMNQKEQWSVLRYIGESTDSCFGLTKIIFLLNSLFFCDIIVKKQKECYLFLYHEKLRNLLYEALNV